MDTIVKVKPKAFTASRRESGLTIRELADHAGVHPATVGHISAYAKRTAEGEEPAARSGRTNIATAQRVAGALGHPVAELFTHTNGDAICSPNTGSSSPARS